MFTRRIKASCRSRYISSYASWVLFVFHRGPLFLPIHYVDLCVSSLMPSFLPLFLGPFYRSFARCHQAVFPVALHPSSSSRDALSLSSLSPVSALFYRGEFSGALNPNCGKKDRERETKVSVLSLSLLSLEDDDTSFIFCISRENKTR